MDLSFNPEAIIHYFDIGMWVLFGLVILVLVLGFVRGLAQGWKYGTFRFIFFALLIAGGIFALKSLSGAVADFSLTGFNQTVSFEMEIDSNTILIESPLTTIKETGTDVISQVLKAFNLKTDPAAITEYALAIALSFASIIALIIEAIVIAIVGNLLCLILWHALFKWFIPKEARKKKNLKIISGFEQAITSILVFAMFISPLTSLANNLSRSFERIPKEDESSNRVVVDSNVYQTITGVIDTYDSSLFSKVFFSWYADGETGMRFDEAFMTYISTIDLSNGDKFTIVNELSQVIKIASYAIDSGLLGDKGFDSQSLAVFATSQYAPKLLRAIGQSQLVQEIAPVFFDALIHFDDIAQYVLTEEGIDVSHYDHAGTFNKLADLYETIIDSGILDVTIDDITGEFVFNQETVTAMLDPQYQSTYDALFETLGSDELAFFNDLITSAIYVQAVKEYKLADEAEEGTMVIGLKDLLPELKGDELNCTPEGRPVAIPASIKGINFVDELKLVFDVVFDLAHVDSDFLPLILTPAFEEEGSFGEEEINGLINLVLNNVDNVEKYIDGRGLESDKKCLLDSNLIANAVPSFLALLENSINSSIGLEGENKIDLSSIVSDYKSKDLAAKKEAAKEETKNLLGVIRPLAGSEEGKALISDFDNLPGLYFDKSGSFLGAKDGLLEALAQGIESIDNSKIFSNLLPSILNKFVGGDDGFLKSSLGLDLKLDLAPKNASGDSILGHELANIIRVYSECQDVVTYLMSAFGGTTDMAVLEKTFSAICQLKTSSNELQLANFLIGIGQSKIFNPIGDDHGTPLYNESIYNIFKMIFDSTGLGNEEMKANLKSVIMDEAFDFDSEINSFVDFIKYICEQKLLATFSSGFSLETMANISFGGLFGKVGSSELLKTLMGDLVDSAVGSNAVFNYVDESGNTVQLSFKNVTDWGAEGAALDTMTKYASIVGDISSIDIGSLDPEMITTLFNYLSGSQLFIQPDAGNTVKWIFPNYLASKIVKLAKGAGEIGRFFTDVEETYEGGVYKTQSKDPSLDDSYLTIKNDVLSYAIEGGTMADVADAQAIFAEEGVRLAEIIRCIGSSGALLLMVDGIDANLGNFKTPYLKSLLDNMSESILLGRTGITQILSTIANMLAPSSKAFGNTNVMFAYQTNDAAERRVIGDAILTILEVATDPVTGLLDAAGKLDTTKLSQMEKLDANRFVAPMLKALNSTEAFTTLSTFQETVAGITQSTFLGQIEFAISGVSWYETEARTKAILPLIDADVRANGGWDAEIDKFTKVLNDFHAMGSEISGGLSFDDYFTEKEYGEDIVGNLLKHINESRLLYPGLPEKFDGALSSLTSGSLAGSGISLSNANTYYAGKGTVDAYSYATRAYDEDECFRLASILGKASKLGSLDLSDISSLTASDVDNVTGLLADFAQSSIFNTLKSGETTSVFQDVMGALFGGDALKEYYISNLSPKDAANASNYVTALEKAKYAANQAYPYISSTNSNSDVSNLIDPSSPNSLHSLLTTITSDSDFSAALANGTFDTLSETQMGILLNALNRCDWTYDIVPNAIASSINSQTLDAVELKRANPYYQYGYNIVLNGSSYENTGVMLMADNYENRYDDDEIELVAKVVSLVKSDSSLTTNLSNKAQILKLKNFLKALDDSYSFHLAGASYLLKTDDSISFTVTDLPVFEQAMYNLYDQSGLAALSYSEVYDGEYTSYQAKLLDKVKNYQDSKWGVELDNLILKDDLTGGLFGTAIDLGFISGGNVSISSSEILSKTPTELGQLLYATNKVDLAYELVTYELQKTIVDTINFKEFSKVTATYDVDASSYSLDLDNAVYGVKVYMASGDAPTLSYEKAGSTFALSPTNPAPNTYEYVLFDGSTIMDRPLAKDISISGAGTISRVEVTFSVDRIIGLSQAELDVQSGSTHTGAINELIEVASSCFYNEMTSSYIDFASDPFALGTLFGTPGKLTKIVNFIKSDKSFFTSKYDSQFNKADSAYFDAGDVSASGILSFQFGSYAVNLFEYMPDYNATNRVPGYKNLHDIFSEGDIVTVSAWLDSHMIEAASFYGAYNALSNIQARYAVIPTAAFSYNGEHVGAYLETSASWNTFEAAFKTGFARRFYADMRDAALLSAHFTSDPAKHPLFAPTASNFIGFLDLTRNDILPLLNDIQAAGMPNKNAVAAKLNLLSEVPAAYEYKDVVTSYYEKAIYEILLINNPGAFGTQPTSFPEAFGTTGYLRNAAIILDPSLA